MKKIDKQKVKIFLRCFIISVIIFVLSISLHFTKVFNFFENKTYDLRMSELAKNKNPCDDIYFIKVDQESIDWASETYGWSWPWPREAYGRIIEFVSAGNAKSIAFDIVFSEPSIYGEEDDLAFAKAEEESGITIQTIFINGDRADGTEHAQLPIPVIADNAAMLANITSSMDDDDIIRRGRLSYEYNGEVYPTLGTAPLYLTDDTEGLKAIPRLEDGTVLLRYQKSMDDYEPFSAMSILKNYDSWKNGEECDFEPDEFEDAYVYVAYYATGLFDICSTPVSKVFPGVGVHITTLDNYLTDSFMIKASDWGNVLWYFTLSLLSSLLIATALCMKKQWLSLFTLIVSGVLLMGIAVSVPYILFFNGIWIVMVGPLFNLALSLLFNIGFSFAVEGKQKKIIKDAFSKCLSKDVVNQILEDPSSFSLGGKQFRMTAVFTDIQQFSSFCEFLSPEEVGSLLNYYLTPMSDILLSEKGTLDKYEGDAIIGFVGAPVEIENHADRACTAAVLMKKREKQMNQEIYSIASSEKPGDMTDDLYNSFLKLVKNNRKIFTRIGINTGYMMAGFFGSDQMKNYTMMGTDVNIASRLEGVNKQYHTGGILISDETKNDLHEDFLVRRLDRVRVINIENPIRLYELIDKKEFSSDKDRFDINIWEKAMDFFESKDYSSAYEHFKIFYNKNPDDGVAAYYISLLERYFLVNKYPTQSDGEGVVFEPETGIFRLSQK